MKQLFQRMWRGPRQAKQAEIDGRAEIINARLMQIYDEPGPIKPGQTQPRDKLKTHPIIAPDKLPDQSPK